MRIIVTGANGDIGEAVGRILREHYPCAIIHGADAAGNWPGGFVFQKMHRLPLASAPEYVSALRQLSEGYDLVLPTSEPELAILATNPDGVADIPLVMVQPSLLQVFLDKLDTVIWLKLNGMAAPESRDLKDAVPSELPLMIKPRRGAGGKGQEVVRSAERLKLAQQELPVGMVAQELLDVNDQEYTCAVFRAQGCTRSIILRRWLKGDRTGKAVVVEHANVTALLEKIANIADLQGCINVQLRLLPSGPKVFEINPRISSTVMMRHKLGFSDLVWWIEAFLGKTIPAMPRQRIGATVYRLAREEIVPTTD